MIDFWGVFAGAMAGALQAKLNRTYEFDLVGVVGLGLISALGGGITRDLLLQRGPSLALTDVRYLLLGLVGGVLGLFCGSGSGERLGKLLVLVDAAALGLFTVAGSTRALSTGLSFLPAVLLGIVTAVGGGSIRDVFSGRAPKVFEQGEAKLKESAQARYQLIATDGVFSMDGYFAKLDKICELAEKYDAMVMVDDSHAVGFIGEQGRGTAELCDVVNRVDIFTGTLGKALGGASGGYISGRKEIIELLRQRSRPYLFSNSIAPPIVAGSLKAFDLLIEAADLRQKLKENTIFFRKQMSTARFNILPGEHPIVPVMFGDAFMASQMADLLLTKGVYVVAFSYPVVPQGKARIRTQISAAHTRSHLEFALEKFVEAKAEIESQ